MSTAKDRPTETRVPLTRERVLRAAIELADERGIDALSMRKLGQSLGVEAMSLYNHVANKDDLLDGIVDVVAGEFELPTGTGWKATMRGYGISAHEVLLRHPWSSALAESRTQSGPIRMRFLETLLGALRGGGFSVAGAYRTMLTLDSYIYGFTLQEVAWPVDEGEIPQSAVGFVERTPGDEFPYLVEIASLVADPAFDPGSAFEVGLDLILDGLERTLVA